MIMPEITEEQRSLGKKSRGIGSDIFNKIMHLLLMKIDDPKDPRLYDRRVALRNLFEKEIDPLDASALLSRLIKKRKRREDKLSFLFNHALSTPTRTELIKILKKKNSQVQGTEKTKFLRPAVVLPKTALKIAKLPQHDLSHTRQQKKKTPQKRKKTPEDVLDETYKKISDPPLRIRNKRKKAKDILKKIRYVLRGIDILFDTVDGDLLFDIPGIGITSLSIIILGGGGGVLVLGAIANGQLGLIIKFIEELKKLEEILDLINSLANPRSIVKAPDVLPNVPLQDAGVPLPAQPAERTIMRPDVDYDWPDGYVNDFGCTVESIAMQFGRYPCHAKFAERISGVRREFRITDPNGQYKDFDAMDLGGGMLYEVKTGYGWIPKEYPSMRKIIQATKDRFVDQAQEQLYIAHKCGYDLKWYFNLKPVANYFKGLIQPKVTFRKFECEKDSDEKERGKRVS